MSQTITIANYPAKNILETTKLTADANSGQAVLLVENNQNFSADKHVVIGRIGSEILEKILVLSIASTTTITSTTNLARTHQKFASVTRIYGNKMRIYRASNVDGTAPADGSFALLDTVDIDFDDQQTKYTDTNGSSAYWYKVTFYDSVGLTETALGDSTAVRGGGYGNYTSVESIRKEAGLQNNVYIADELIDEKRQAAQALINSTLSGRYVVPFSSPINPLIAEITRVLAAGYVLTKEFGNTSSSTYKEGVDKIERITNKDKTGLLDRLDSGSLSLVGETGVSEESATGGNTAGWPNSSTATASASVGGAVRQIRMSDRY